MNGKLLVVRNLNIQFFTHAGVVKALNGVNLDIERTGVHGLVGETGCGKSVTALSIMRLIQPPGRITNGKIMFEGEDLLQKSEKEMMKIRGSKISMIFQDPTSSLNPLLRVGEQIAEGIRFHEGLNKREAMKKAIKMMETVAIPESSKRANDFPHMLSGGMKQRIMIAIALSCHPSLLIADEPTTNLDVTIQAQILNEMKTLQNNFRTAILLITHNFGVVAQMCNRVAVMYAGRIVEEADTETLFMRPKHPYTLGLMKAIPKIKQRVRRLHDIPGFVPNLIHLPPGCSFHPRCHYATEICRKKVPEDIEVGPGHTVACHNIPG